jgi:hypothetical protein
VITACLTLWLSIGQAMAQVIAIKQHRSFRFSAKLNEPNANEKRGRLWAASVANIQLLLLSVAH